MAFVLRLFGIRRRKPNLIFLKARDAFAQKDYFLAHKLFLDAYKAFPKDHSMRLTCITNAANAAEQAGSFKGAGDLYFDAAIIRARREDPPKSIIGPLQKALDTKLVMNEKNGKDKFTTSQVCASLFVAALASQDFALARKGVNVIKALVEDNYTRFIVKTWELVHSKDTFIRSEKLPSVNLPGEFSRLLTEAEKVMLAYAALDVTIERVSGGKYKVGDPISIKTTLEAFAPMEISRFRLKTGNKGSVTETRLPKLPIALEEPGVLNSEYIVEANLAGEWKLGPALVTYSIGNNSFEVHSNHLAYEILSPEPILVLDAKINEIEKENVLETLIQIRNEGKGGAEQVIVEINPTEGILILSGTSKKLISSLSPGEEFNFPVVLRKDVQDSDNTDSEIIQQKQGINITIQHSTKDSVGKEKVQNEDFFPIS